MVIGLSRERMDDNLRAYLGWNKLVPRLVGFYMKWLYFSMCDHHIANSRYTAEELRTASIGHPIQRSVWVRPMGVDFRELSPTHRSSLARHNLLRRVKCFRRSDPAPVRGTPGSGKNLALLLEALGQLQAERWKDWRLIFVGDSVEREPLLS
jgi:hypothetical protein